MKGAGTDEKTLIDVLGSVDNKDALAIKARYKEMFSRDLEKDIVSETSGAVSIGAVVRSSIRI